MVLWKLQVAIWKFKRLFGSLKMNILKPKMAKNGKMHFVGTKFYKMTTPNFGSNSLCGPSTVFQGRWPNQGGGPQDPFREATICSTGSLLELEMATRKLKLAIWKFKIGLWKLQMAIWKLKMALWKVKNEHFEAQNCQNWQNAPFGPQILQNDIPQFWFKFFIWP